MLGWRDPWRDLHRNCCSKNAEREPLCKDLAIGNSHPSNQTFAVSVKMSEHLTLDPTRLFNFCPLCLVETLRTHPMVVLQPISGFQTEY